LSLDVEVADVRLQEAGQSVPTASGASPIAQPPLPFSVHQQIECVEDERLHADVTVDCQLAQAPVSLWDKQITQAMREAAQ
jgi:hypothetical protein